jgi:hypothetical protein
LLIVEKQLPIFTDIAAGSRAIRRAFQVFRLAELSDVAFKQSAQWSSCSRNPARPSAVVTHGLVVQGGS